MYYHGRRTARTSIVEKISLYIAGSAQSVITTLVEGVSDIIKDYILLVDVQKENRKLKEEIDTLLNEALLAKRLAIENQELRGLLGFKKERQDIETIPCNIISREVSPFYRVTRVSVDLDGRTLPSSDMAVITSQGLLGRVVQLSGRYADVMLVSDARSRVACEVLGKGILGVIIGAGVGDQYRAKLRVSATEEPLEPNSVIITSGHDRIFPRGVEIGYILDPTQRKTIGNLVEYDVTLAVNPAQVNHCFVAGGNKEN